MPCWEVRTMSVQFNVKNKVLLEKAIRALDWEDFVWEGNTIRILPSGRRGFSIDLNRGEATILPSQQDQLNRLKRQYSRECLKRAAKLQGWQLKSRDAGLEQTKGVLRR